MKLEEGEGKKKAAPVQGDLLGQTISFAQECFQFSHFICSSVHRFIGSSVHCIPPWVFFVRRPPFARNHAILTGEASFSRKRLASADDGLYFAVNINI